ncbi:MAG: hypothetical protein KC636_17710 [Myxococcales bacterium]|nr:hypothetical protein [Myxococcales bacterium]
MRPASDGDPSTSWLRSALAAGVTAGTAGALVLALGFYVQFPDVLAEHLWLPWSTAIVVFGVLSGATLGAAICGGMVAAQRLAARGAPGWLANDLVGAGVGAGVGGLLPSAVGVVGYGSLTLPYAGTGLLSMSVFTTFLLLAGLCSLPASTGQASRGSPRRAAACALLAAGLVVIPFGLTIAGIIAAALPLPVIRQLIRALGGAHATDSLLLLSLFAALLSLLLGAFVGPFIALSRRLTGILQAASMRLG